MIRQNLNRAVRNELALLRYSARFLAGRNAIALAMIAAALVLLVVTHSAHAFGGRLNNLLFQLESFGPLLGIVIFGALVSAEMSPRQLDLLRASGEGAVRIILRRLLHATLLTGLACLVVLGVLRITYTAFRPWEVLAIILPASLCFGMLGVLVAAATRRPLAGHGITAAVLVISIAGQQAEPVLLESYTTRARLAGGRVLEESNWLIAKFFFGGAALLLACATLRILRTGQRMRPTLAAVLILAACHAGLNWLWNRPLPNAIANARDETIDIREKDGTLFIRIARPALTIRDHRAFARTLIVQERYQRDGENWIRQGESPYHPASEVDLVHIDVDAALDPLSRELAASVRMKLRAREDLRRGFFHLAPELRIDRMEAAGNAVPFRRIGDLVELTVAAGVKKGDALEVAMQYRGHLRFPTLNPGEGASKNLLARFHGWYPTTRSVTQNWVDPFTCTAVVRLPKPWRMAGATTLCEENAQVVQRWASSIPIHIMPLCVGRFREYDGRCGDIPISVHVLTLEEAAARRILDRCADVLRVHQQAFGRCPFDRVAIVENPFQASSGVAYAGLISLRADTTALERERELHEVLLPHELAHLWWRAGLPKWLAEAGAVYGNLLYLDQTAGRPRAMQWLDQTVLEPYGRAPGPLKPLIDDHGNLPSIYARGAGLLVTLEQRLGREKLLAALHAFHDPHATDAEESDINQRFEEAMAAAGGEATRAYVAQCLRSASPFDFAQLFPGGQGASPGRQAVSLRTFTTEDGLAAGTVRDLLLGQDGHLYAALGQRGVIGGSEWGLHRHDRVWRPIVPDARRGLTILAMAQGRDGTLWLGGYGALWSVRGDASRERILGERRHGRLGAASFSPNPTATSPIPGSIVYALLVDADQRLWIGTDHGLSVLDPAHDAWRHFSHADGLPGQAILTLVQDHAGTIWAGTDSGLASFDGARWTAHPKIAANDMILAAAVSPDGTLWLGAARSGLLAIREGQLERVPAHPIIRQLVCALAIDHRGRVWAGTPDGLACLDGGAWSVLTTRNAPLPSNRIQALVVDGGGDLWIGTDAGVTRYNTRDGG